jgi:methionyl-tRNA synthetase
MVQKYNKGSVAASGGEMPSEFRKSILNLEKYYDDFMAAGQFSKALDNIFALIGIINKYIETTKPWNLKKEKKEKELLSFLYALCEGIRIISIYLYPIMPETSFSIQKQLGVKDVSFSGEKLKWGSESRFLIKKEKPLFPRVDVS